MVNCDVQFKCLVIKSVRVMLSTPHPCPFAPRLQAGK